MASPAPPPRTAGPLRLALRGASALQAPTLRPAGRVRRGRAAPRRGAAVRAACCVTEGKGFSPNLCKSQDHESFLGRVRDTRPCQSDTAPCQSDTASCRSDTARAKCANKKQCLQQRLEIGVLLRFVPGRQCNAYFTPQRHMSSGGHRRDRSKHQNCVHPKQASEMRAQATEVPTHTRQASQPWTKSGRTGSGTHRRSLNSRLKQMGVFVGGAWGEGCFIDASSTPPPPAGNGSPRPQRGALSN